MSHSDVLLGEVETLRRLRRHRADRAERALREAKRAQQACLRTSSRPRKHLNRLGRRKPGKVRSCSVSIRARP